MLSELSKPDKEGIVPSQQINFFLKQTHVSLYPKATLDITAFAGCPCISKPTVVASMTLACDGWDAHSHLPGLAGVPLVASRALFCSRAPTAPVTVGSFFGLIWALPCRERGQIYNLRAHTGGKKAFHSAISDWSHLGTCCTQGRGHMHPAP